MIRQELDHETRNRRSHPGRHRPHRLRDDDDLNVEGRRSKSREGRTDREPDGSQITSLILAAEIEILESGERVRLLGDLDDRIGRLALEPFDDFGDLVGV